MYVGQEVLDFLNDKLSEIEPGKSAHWQEKLRGFTYSEDGRVSGIEGLGTVSRDSVVRRVLHWSAMLPLRVQVGNFKRLSEALSVGRYIAGKQGRLFDLDIFRQVLVCDFSASHIPGFGDGEVAVVIGDGYGVLASLLLINTNYKVVSINLQEVLIADYLYTRDIVADEEVMLVEEEAGLSEAVASNNTRLIYIRANNYELLRSLNIHVAFANCCMHEMNPSIIASYFSALRNSKGGEPYFYCNSRVEKTMPDGTVTRFDEYPWEPDDEILVEGPCLWNEYFYSARPPFYHKYAGDHKHRLVQLSRTR